MVWYELHLMKQLDKDAVAVNRVNRKIIEKYKHLGYVHSLGKAPKGPKVGKECVLIQPAAYKYWDELKHERKESFRFWVALWMNPISAILGAIVGYLLANKCS